MQQWPDDCIDLTVTSPPYDNLRTYGGHSWDFEGVAQQLWRVTKPGGVVVWVVADATVDGSETGTSFRQALRFKEIGFRLHDTMIWDKGTFRYPDEGRYYGCFEYMFILSSGKPACANLIKDRPNIHAGTLVARASQVRLSDGTLHPNAAYRNDPNRRFADVGCRMNIWRINSTSLESERSKHTAPFPESLARDHILSWSNEGDVVLDPFCGSGTTPKMARAMGRRYVGIEINPAYVEICRKRLAQKVIPFADSEPQVQRELAEVCA
jgi:site-specific DNA-methyltransferase (adenine-specific)